MDRFTITRTHRWGNADINIRNVYSTSRSKSKRDDVIRMANEMIERERLHTNEEVEYEVLLAYDKVIQSLYTVLKRSGKKVSNANL